MINYLTKKFEENSNLKHCKFLEEFTTINATTFEQGEIPQINISFFTKFFAKNSNLKHHKFLEEFTTLNVTPFEQGEIPSINIYIYGKNYNSKLPPLQ